MTWGCTAQGYPFPETPRDCAPPHCSSLPHHSLPDLLLHDLPSSPRKSKPQEGRVCLVLFAAKLRSSEHCLAYQRPSVTFSQVDQ